MFANAATVTVTREFNADMGQVVWCARPDKTEGYVDSANYATDADAAIAAAMAGFHIDNEASKPGRLVMTRRAEQAPVRHVTGLVIFG